MKLNQIVKNQIAAVLAFALIISGVSAFADRKQTEEITDTQESGLTAGISTVLNTEDLQAASLTSGVSDVFTDFHDVRITDTDTNLVASGQTEEDDGTFCGYTNLGMSSIGEGNLNVRKSATTDSEIVGKMTNHNACEILSTDGEWSEITSGKVTGYVKNEYLLTGEEALAVAKEEVQTIATVHTETLRVRAEANTDAKIRSLVGDGEDLVVISDLGDWIEVEVDDETGFVSAEYVELSEKLPTAQTMTEVRYGAGVSDVRVDLVSYACQFVGNRYVWGGTSLTNGVDCSGFTMQIYAKYGISLPHSSRAQPGYGTKISASEAQPGDLFFYGSGSSINHVAIYIGNGQIVHASNSRDGIKISNAYYRSPICVVRYLQ